MRPWLAALLLLPLAGCIGGVSGADLAAGAPKALTITSADFQPMTPIPRAHTCQGANSTPQLTIAGAPANAQVYAMLMEDPDATRGTVMHWAFWDLPVARGAMAQGASMAQLGAKEAGNGTAPNPYRGPCPPAGTGAHRYTFQAFALAEPLGLAPGTRAADFKRAIDGKALAWGDLVGLYERQPQ